MFSIFNFLQPQPKRNLGVIGKGEFTEGVYPQSDVVAKVARPLFRTIKSLDEARKFPYQYQDGTSGCVAFTISKIGTVLYHIKTGRIIKFSPAFIYVPRINAPEEGMVFDDAQYLASKGLCLYDLLPCEGISEKEINSLIIEDYHKQSADAFAFPKNWVELPLDFDTVASTIENTQKPIMLWFSFGPKEFFGTQYPRIVQQRGIWNHSVTAVDAFTLNGVEYILIEDSADKENIYRKLISRSFFNRCWLARYPINFKFAITDKPVYDGSIISVQKIMQYDKCFPSNIPFAENWGPVSRDSMKKWQDKYAINPTGLLDSVTVSILKKLYA